MIYAANIVSAVLQLYIAHNLFSNLLGKMKNKKAIQLMVYVIVCFFDTLASIYIDKSTVLLPIILLSSIFMVSLTYKGQLFSKILFSILLSAIFALCEVLAGMFIVALTHMDMNTITQTNHTLFLFGVLLSNMLAFFFVKLIGYVKHTPQVKISVTILIGLIFSSFASLCPLYIIGRYTYDFVDLHNTVTVMVISILMIGSNLFLFHFYETQLSHEQQKIEYSFILHQFAIQAEYYKKLVNEQEMLSKTIHDIKNNLLAIKGYILGADPRGALKRIDDICLDIGNRTKIYTSNIVVDTVLNAKEKEAYEDGIGITVIASAFRDNAIDAIDLGIVLGNALDNAIEACRKIPAENNKEIFVKILLIENYISIVIENSVDKPVEIVDGMVVSTKKNPFHGYGIKNIKTLVEKYDGDVQLRYEANKFSINMLLKSS